MGKLKATKKAVEKALDMSHAARMERAREMGFDTDTVWYHGSYSPEIDQFKDSKIGSSNDSGFFGRGHYFANTAAEAKYYGPNVTKHHFRGNALDLDNNTGDLSFSGHFKSWAGKLREIGALDEKRSRGLDAITAADNYIDSHYRITPAVAPDGSEGFMASVPNPAEGFTDEIATRAKWGREWAATKEEALEELRHRFYGEMQSHHPEVFPGLEDAEESLSDYVRVGMEGGAQALTDAARAAGYDAISVADELVVFDPARVRSTSATFDPAEKLSPLLTAGVAGAAVLGAEDSEAGVISKGGRKVIEAFHGSPHKFDKFSMDAIGTGEGAQAYGHGLYFADSEGVARGYRDTLSYDPDKFRIDGQQINDYYNALDQRAATLPVDEARPLYDRMRVVEDLMQNADPKASAKLADELGQGDWFKSIDFEAPGSLYRAHLDVDPDTLLDWDKPLSEQSEAVRDAAAELLVMETGVMPGHSNFDAMVANVRPQIDASEMRGGEFIQKANRAMNNAGAIGEHMADASPAIKRGDRAVSDYLNQRGIPGIRYLDGDSRSAGEGSYNYVMFDDSKIDIQERGFAAPEVTAALATASVAYLQARQQKKSQWEGLRADLLGAINQANELAGQALEAIDLPWKGIIGASRVAGGLAAGESFDQAMNAGANQVRQPLEQTAYDLGGAMTDATGSPLAGTAVNVGVNLGGPI